MKLCVFTLAMLLAVSCSNFNRQAGQAADTAGGVTKWFADTLSSGMNPSVPDTSRQPSARNSRNAAVEQSSSTNQPGAVSAVAPAEADAEEEEDISGAERPGAF